MIKAVIFDIYGTLLKSKVGDLDDSLNQKDIQINILEKLKIKYELKYNPEILLENFKEEINKAHKIKKNNGIESPEVIIENIWKSILPTNINAKKFAFDFYDFGGKRELYSNTKEILEIIKNKGIKIGIISNAQFYTKIDMDNLLNKNIFNIFEKELCFFSFEVGFSKPNKGSFMKIIEILKKQGISKEETLYVGNHAVKDIKTANEVGIKSCLFESDEVKYEEGINADFNIKDLIEIKNILE